MRADIATATLTALVAMLLAGCATSTDYLEYRPMGSPQRVADRLLTSIRACWFSQTGGGFSGYALESELASHSNRPRLLIVRENERGGLPQLVVEASRDNRRTSVKLFGPLLMTPLGPRIRADIERWTSGQPAAISGCS
ncbi:MAG TPA: hypothetical protein VKN63_00580 [Afifellaceae bacterium]|nr:hypothetical protein [Afifellaceae bacterium]